MARGVRGKRTTRRSPMGTEANALPRAARGRTASPATPVALRASGVEVGDVLRDYIHTRCGFKLGKFAPRIERVSVRLEDVSGPTGAPSRRCAVKVVFSRHETILVQVVDADHRAAFDHAIDATERAVRRSLDRVRVKARRRD
jgi:ribosome-associated translation inhibitor RaiA